jgi:TatD DNase family protein
MIDSHCHIHEADYKLDKNQALKDASAAGVDKVICIGTDIKTSKEAIEFATEHSNVWATIGLHPHDAKLGDDTFKELKALLGSNKIVGIGECGLDFYYNHSSRQEQIEALEFQIQLAVDNNLPLSFHVRDAFDDFWPIIDNFSGAKGVVHSFTAGKKELQEVLKRDLYVGINGIITFTKNQDQLLAAKEVPLKKLLLETDAPFLTPVPLRGKINEPGNVRLIAGFMAKLKGETFNHLARETAVNTERLFGI